VGKVITATEMRDRLLTRQQLKTALMLVNAGMDAGEPMVFACDECLAPIWVPEMYVAKPRLCPDCGGQWCRP
jgi:hypothetical protein